MNPLLTGLDYPDPDVIRVADTYYMITTTMHFLPGAEILRSFDLANWERVGAVFEVLEDDPAHRLETDQGIYGKGMWAATLRHHRGVFHVVFVANETRKTYLFRSKEMTGPWQRSEISGFFHDASLLFDGDRVFLASGNTEIRITELDADCRGPLPGGVDRVAVRETGNPILGYEGCHFYRIRDHYYLFLIHSHPDRWRRVQACFWSDSIEGEFQGGDVLDDDLAYGGNGVAQGGIVDTPEGDWFAVLFQDRGAVGRIPVLVPVSWKGVRPVLGIDGQVSATIDVKSTRPGHRYEALVGDDDFRGSLRSSWQWNHLPDPQGWELRPEVGQLRVRTTTLTSSPLQARNTLTQRMFFPRCSAEVTLHGGDLEVGDTAGLLALQSSFGLVALRRCHEGYVAVMEHVVGDRVVEEARLPVPGNQIRVRIEVSFSANDDFATFWVKVQGQWSPLGPRHRLVFQLDHFVGCRFGLFTMATQTVGGEAGFSDFRYHREGNAGSAVHG